MDLRGVEVRPIRQMSGGSSFNEVFLTDVRVPDRLRLGPVGGGWQVALTTLGFERDHSAVAGPRRRRHVGSGACHRPRPGSRRRPRHSPGADEALYIQLRVEEMVNRRAADLRAAGATPGPEASLGKLLWTRGHAEDERRRVRAWSAPALIADTGRWATYEWGEHVLGAPGYRIAGGSDEIQRTIIGERVLGLPPEPRVDKDGPWSSTHGRPTGRRPCPDPARSARGRARPGIPDARSCVSARARSRAAPDSHQLAVGEHVGAVGDRERHVHVLLDEQHPAAGVVGDGPEHREEALDDHRRQAEAHLVDHEQPRPRGQRPRASANICC